MLYKLAIRQADCEIEVFGNKEILESAQQDWLRWCEDVSRQEHRLLIIHGVCDAFDRAEKLVYIRMDTIVGMMLWKYY